MFGTVLAPAPMAVNSPMSTAACMAAVFWYAVKQSKMGAGFKRDSSGENRNDCYASCLHRGAEVNKPFGVRIEGLPGVAGFLPQRDHRCSLGAVMPGLSAQGTTKFEPSYRS